MNILVVNDDGIESEGIKILAQKLMEYGSVFVVAPHTEQSGAGHSITLKHPMKLHTQKGYIEGVKAWSLEGKPADCVKFALYGLNLDIDLVVSGVNNGANLGTDINYSGTIAGASEGVILGYPAIAVSTDFSCFDMASKHLSSVLDIIIDEKILSDDIVLNVNFPCRDTKEIKGIMITKQGIRPYVHEFEADGQHFWARGTWDDIEHEKGTDTYAYENGYISITPIKIDRTDYEYIVKLKNIIE